MLVGAELRRFVASSAIVLASTIAVSFAAPGRAVAAFSCSTGTPTYTVRSGDGWFAIAQRVAVPARALLEANGAHVDDLLVPGDRLCLPAGADLAAACGQTYDVRPGDGWSSIARKAGVAASALLGANGATVDRAIHPGQTLCLPDGARSPAAGGGSTGGSGGSYTVARGDSWFGIAQRAGVTGSALLAANDASASDLIVPGQVIRLPAGARQPTSPAEPTRFWVELQAAPTQGPCGFTDSWRDARSGGRRHLGVDVFTRHRAYVYAVVDGRLTGRTWDHPGMISGNSWTLTGADGTRYFYAHLYDFNPDLRVGSTVRAGEILGWVGGTGNASADHLHFEIRPDGGAPINPYPIVKAQGACNRGTPYRQPSGWIPD